MTFQNVCKEVCILIEYQKEDLKNLLELLTSETSSF
jgi:hypothetical protein